MGPESYAPIFCSRKCVRRRPDGLFAPKNECGALRTEFSLRKTGAEGYARVFGSEKPARTRPDGFFAPKNARVVLRTDFLLRKMSQDGTRRFLDAIVRVAALWILH